jgi:hypothetical protein
MTPRPLPDDLVDAWQGTLAQWTNRLAHDTLLIDAIKHDQLPWLALCYREYALDNPHDHIAHERLAAVHRAAMLLAVPASTIFDAPTERLPTIAR